MSTNSNCEGNRPFVLRADAQIHHSDARAVAAFPATDDFLLSASRDTTIALLQVPPASKDDLISCHTFVGHVAFVNFVFLHPGLELLDGASCIVSGSNDHHVAIWDSATAEVLAVLDGHTQGVCHGTFVNIPDTKNRDDTSHGDIVTGDWAGVCHVFDHASGKIKLSYTQHTTAIRSIAHLPTTHFVVTASGDKSIHAWHVRTGLTEQVFRDHADVVQCVCAINASSFASGSNDCTVRLWKLGQESALLVIQGHDSLIYCVAYSLLTDEVYSASEDHTVRVWNVAGALAKKHPLDTSSYQSCLSPVQVIYHPCVVWGLAILPMTGDLATAGSDGRVRLWTRNDALIASLEKIELLNAAIAAQTVDVKLTQLDSGSSPVAGIPDDLKVVSIETIYQQRGRYEGEKLFAKNEAGEVEVYMWGSNRWEKVGTIVTGPDQTPCTRGSVPREKHFYQGKSYDYLFDVDVDGRMLKLGYNVGDDIFQTAQRFINEHPGIISQDSREEVQNFLLTHISPKDQQQVPGIRGDSTRNISDTMTSLKPTEMPQSTQQKASDGASDAPVVPYRFSEMYGKFNADCAQQKLNDFLHHESYSNSLYKPVDELMAFVQNFLTLSDHEICLLCKDLTAVGQNLPKGRRFPVIDAIRFLLYQVAISPTSVTSIPRILDALFVVLETLLSPPDGLLTHDKTIASDAEMLVSLRLLCNAFAVLVKLSCDLSEVHRISLLALTQRLGVLALHKLSNANIKSALVNLVINISVYLSGVIAQQVHLKDIETQQDDHAKLSETFVLIAGKILFLEPLDSAHTLSVMRAVYTLFHVPKPEPQVSEGSNPDDQRVDPIWLKGAWNSAKRIMGYTIHSIAARSSPQAKPFAEKLVIILGLSAQ